MTASDAAPSEARVVDLRGGFRDPGDQGRRGTCVAFAVTAIHEADRGPAEGADEPEDLSEETLFWGAKQVDGDTSDGTRFGSANTALQRWGQPNEAFWPYDESREHRDPRYVPPAGALEPENCRCSALRPIAVELTAMRHALDTGHSVALGIPVWDGLRHARNEPLPPPAPGELYPTRHAVVVTGYDPDRDAILLHNSWGTHWGTNGHLWVSDGVLAYATGAWVVDAAALDAAAPQQTEEELLQ